IDRGYRGVGFFGRVASAWILQPPVSQHLSVVFDFRVTWHPPCFSILHEEFDSAAGPGEDAGAGGGPCFRPSCAGNPGGAAEAERKGGAMKAIWTALIGVYTRWRYVEDTDAIGATGSRRKRVETSGGEIDRL